MKNVARTYKISEEVDRMIETLSDTRRQNKSVIVEIAVEELFRNSLDVAESQPEAAEPQPAAQ